MRDLVLDSLFKGHRCPFCSFGQVVAIHFEKREVRCQDAAGRDRTHSLPG